jgi:nucleotide-binding universal stress UspA family protein
MRVLLGVGGRDDAFTALDRTIARAREADDELTIAVLENPESSPSVAEVESAVRDRLAETGFGAEVVVLEGHPGSRLVEYAESEGYDRIVLGGGETSPLGKVSLGGIAEFVLLNANTSVTLVR